MRVSVFWLAVVVLMGGCATSGKQVVRSAYRDKITTRTTLGLMPLGIDLLPSETPVQVVPLLTQRGHDLYYRLFGLAFSDLACLTVWEAGPDYDAGDTMFEMQPLALASDDSIAVPVPLGTVRVEGRTPSFLLFVDDLRVFYGISEGREALATLATEQLIVSAECEYVIWDNQAGQPAAYGRLMETAPTEAGANVQAPITVAYRRLVAAIIRKSPFLFNTDLVPGG